MYKYSKIIALFATIGWLAFSYAAFKGFHFWYLGFSFFFWLSLGALNYRHETTLWLLHNRPKKFFRFYAVVAAFFFFIDYIIAIKLTNLWSFPYYNDWFDWVRLYLLLYPFFALFMVELLYFIAGIFGEKLRFVRRPMKFWHRVTDFLDLMFLIVILVSPFAAYLGFIPNFVSFIVWTTILWGIVATVKFRYHIAHWFHYLSIFIVAFVITVILNEIPNTGAFEWIYHQAPILNQNIFEVPLWVIVGWYIAVLILLRFWIYFVLNKKAN